MLTFEGNIPADLFEAGQRASDTLNTAIAQYGWWSIRSKWMAFALADGKSDNILYDSKRDAVRHQKDEFRCAYVCFRNLGQGARWRDMALFIKFNRDIYSKGYRMPDPDDVNGGPQPMMSARWHDFYRGQLVKPLTPADMERLFHEPR